MLQVCMGHHWESIFQIYNALGKGERDPRDFGLCIISPAIHDQSLLFPSFSTKNHQFKFVGLHAYFQLVVSASNLVSDIGVKTVELDQGFGIFKNIFDLNIVVRGPKTSAIFSHVLISSGFIAFYFWVIYLWHFRWPDFWKPQHHISAPSTSP